MPDPWTHLELFLNLLTHPLNVLITILTFRILMLKYLLNLFLTISTVKGINTAGA